MITIESTDITTMLGYASTLISDLMPLIAVIMGISLALWIFEALFHRNK